MNSVQAASFERGLPLFFGHGIGVSVFWVVLLPNKTTMNITAITLSALIVTASFSSFANDGEDWTQTVQRDGIITYSGIPDKNGVRPSLAEMEVPFSLKHALAAITDVASYTAWTPYCSRSEVIQEITDSSFIYYQIISAPVVKDRDLVAEITISATDSSAVVTIKARPELIDTKWRTVRIEEFETTYWLTATENGTEIKCKSSLDIGGSIPSFLLNTMNEQKPFETFQSLRKHMAKG